MYLSMQTKALRTEGQIVLKYNITLHMVSIRLPLLTTCLEPLDQPLINSVLKNLFKSMRSSWSAQEIGDGVGAAGAGEGLIRLTLPPRNSSTGIKYLACIPATSDVSQSLFST